MFKKLDWELHDVLRFAILFVMTALPVLLIPASILGYLSYQRDNARPGCVLYMPESHVVDH
jgi:hypothetical protein